MSLPLVTRKSASVVLPHLRLQKATYGSASKISSGTHQGSHIQKNDADFLQTVRCADQRHVIRIGQSGRYGHRRTLLRAMLG